MFWRKRHKWSDWLVTDRGDVFWYNDKVESYLVQERHCLTCGKMQLHEQEHNGGYSCTDRRSTMSARTLKKDGIKA